MVRIDPQDPTPPFEQIRAQIVAGTLDGSLPAGTRIPTVRGLAAELQVAAGTVAKAYRRLEEDGIIETRGRSGSVIAAAGDSSRQQIELLTHELVTRARQLGVTDAQVRETFDAALAQLAAEH
ncbi:GntR family transcriptional regulator [Mycetocola sp. JXN-3]|uniref:GntR family transcriptional regulator n=1 Tax=Mycetocola sp. JXN-3 TaxID=2116510 RepID=UPI00165CF495|nr:GntR family transcriptional regulator [Mycetocola sp. JXN-3]